MAHTPWSKRLFALTLSYVLYSSSWFVSSNKDGRLAVNGLERSIFFPRIVEYALSTFLIRKASADCSVCNKGVLSCRVSHSLMTKSSSRNEIKPGSSCRSKSRDTSLTSQDVEASVLTINKNRCWQPEKHEDNLSCCLSLG